MPQRPRTLRRHQRHRAAALRQNLYKTSRQRLVDKRKTIK
jgi:hypothetical protein